MAAIATLKAILGIDTAQFKAGMRDVKGATNDVKTVLAGVGRTLAAAFSVGAIVAAGRGLAKWASDASLAAQNAGILTRDMLALTDVAVQNGLETGDMQKLLAKLQASLYEAAQGSAEYAKVFANIGISYRELLDLDPTQQLIAVSRAAFDAGIPLQALADIFGERLGPNAVAALKQLSEDGLPKVSEAAADTADRINYLGDQYDRLTEKVKRATAAALGWVGSKIERNATEVGTILGSWAGGAGLHEGIAAGSRATQELDDTKAKRKAAQSEMIQNTSKMMQDFADQVSYEQHLAEIEKDRLATQKEMASEEKKIVEWFAKFDEQQARLREQLQSVDAQGQGVRADSMAAVGGSIGNSRANLGIADRQLRVQIEQRDILRQIRDSEREYAEGMENQEYLR